jgi:anti-sigma B factor antagonist
VDFRVSTVRQDSATIVVVTGDVDLETGPLLRDSLLAALDAGPSRLVLDLSQVTFMDSSGLGALLGAHRHARLAGAEMVLAACSERVIEILQLTNLDQVLPMHSSVADALAQPLVLQPERAAPVTEAGSDSGAGAADDDRPNNGVSYA